MNLKEAKLAEPTFNYFKSKGYKLYAEYSIYFRPVDFIAYKKDSLIAIELKTSLNKKVIQQACSCKSSVDLVYVVVSTNPNKSSLEICKKNGIGVISIKHEIKELIKPSIDGYTNLKKRNQIINELSRMKESMDAGKPNLKGKGPAQSIREEVKKLKKEGKSWKEIYDLVPNHYSSYKSLQSSMILLDEREMIKNRLNSQKENFEKTLIKYLKLMNLWNDKKTLLSNKRNWLKLESNYIYGHHSVKSLNSYKYYDSLEKYLKRRIKFYQNNQLTKDKDNLLKKIKVEKFIDQEYASYFEEVIYILLQERLITSAYIPVVNGKLFKDQIKTSLWQLKKEYDDYIDVYFFNSDQSSIFG